MRRNASALLGLLLVLGISPAGISGRGHLHAGAGHDQTAAVHVDHIHLEGDHSGHHHAGPDPASNLAEDHQGDDAVSLTWVSSQAIPKRLLPFLAVPAIRGDEPEISHAGVREAPVALPPDPPPHYRPPGRAPPA